MAAKRKASTKKDLESKIAELEQKLSKLSEQFEAKPEPKPAETPKPEAPKPAETPAATTKPKGTLPKGAEPKPAETPKPEAPKPAETTTQLPATLQEALENAYYIAPMTSFHDYRAKVTGYSPAPNRYFVRRTAPVGKVPTSNWNEQKTKVTGYTQPSNQYFATRARLAYHPPDKTFGSFSGTNLSVEGVELQAPKPEPEAPKPAKGTLPRETKQVQHDEGKAKKQLLEEYENDYLQRIEQEKIEQEKANQESVEAEAKSKSQSSGGRLPKGFEPTPEPETPKSSKGTLPKGF